MVLRKGDAAVARLAKKNSGRCKYLAGSLQRWPTRSLGCWNAATSAPT